MLRPNSFTPYLITAIFVVILLVFAAFGAMAQEGRNDGHCGEAGHWYPEECCDCRHCKPLEPGEIVFTAEGWFIPALGYAIAERDARRSRDHRAHLCRFENGSLIVAENRPCLFVPEANY